jgi:hypothetical protein
VNVPHSPKKVPDRKKIIDKEEHIDVNECRKNK